MAFSAETFIEQFAIPLVEGGAVHVGAPLDREDLRQLEDQVVHSEPALRLAKACGKRAATLWPERLVAPLDQFSASLLVGAHNTLFISHPQRAALFRSTRGTREVVSFAASCLSCGAPADDGAAIARHALLGRLPWLERDDVTIRFWAGQRAYYGQEPPARITAWPRMRRVQREEARVRWLETEMLPEQRRLLATLLSASPITDLLAIDQRGRPRPDFVALAPLLGRPRIARLVSYEYAARGKERFEQALCLGVWRIVAEATQGFNELALGAAEIPPRRPRATLRRGLRTIVGLVQYLAVTQAMVGELVLPARNPVQLGYGALLAAAKEAGLLEGGEALGAAELQHRFYTGVSIAASKFEAGVLQPMVDALKAAWDATEATAESAAG